MEKKSSNNYEVGTQVLHNNRLAIVITVPCNIKFNEREIAIRYSDSPFPYAIVSIDDVSYPLLM